MSLNIHYKQKINKIRNHLFKLIGKLERTNIKEHLLSNNLLNELDINLDNLECSLIKLQYDINEFLDVKNNISNEKKERIEQNHLQNQVIKDLIPFYMMYYMSIDKTNENENNNVNALD